MPTPQHPPVDPPLSPAAAQAPGSPPPDERGPTGSRRRRLWELDAAAHCPLVGVCLPIAALRRLVDKTVGGQAIAGDYELHCGVITDCRWRSPLAEALQRELDRRYAIPLRQASRAKTSEALAAWWEDALRGHDVAGALWATMTHPRCDAVLHSRVLGDVHMLQHQAGMASRVELDRLEALIDENAVLGRELGAAQQRSARQGADHARRLDELQREIVQLRAQLVVRETALAQAREELHGLEASIPGLKSRVSLAQEVQRQAERIQALERSLLQSRHEAETRGRRIAALWAERESEEPDSAPAAQPVLVSPTYLDDRAVLCVGGRPAAVPLYRHIVEKVGGRFLHHDGGEEESTARLDATLAAADMVICQTGCISHNAYWRVKDHCKRSGKPCVFVESPSSAGIRRALIALTPTPSDADQASDTA